MYKLLEENQLDFSSLLPTSLSVVPLWINSIDTTTDLSTFKKHFTNQSIYKKYYFDLIQDLHREKIYTEASKSTDGVDGAVVWDTSEYLYKLSNSCSIFTAECIAILKALYLIKKIMTSKIR